MMPTVLLVFEFLGTTELMVIAFVALIIFGPRKLPEIGRTVGRALAEFKRTSEDFKRTWEYEVDTERTQTALRAEQEVVQETVIPHESLIGDGGEGGDIVNTEAVVTNGDLEGQTISRAPTDFATSAESAADDSADEAPADNSDAPDENPADDPADENPVPVRVQDS